MVLLHAQGLTKRYGDRPALLGVDLAAHSGKITGLLGRNGAGKTTALECILGLRRPDAGSVMVCGVDALRYPGRAKCALGAVLQSAALQDRITPRRALRHFAAFFDSAMPCEQAVVRFGLAGFADAAFHSLSAGQKQRLFLALAFLHRPKVLVLDEPTAGLDPQSKVELHELLRELCSDGVAVLFSTHDLDEAEKYFDTVAVIHEGRVVAADTPAALIASTRRPVRIRLATAAPIEIDELACCPGITTCTGGAGYYEVACGDLDQGLTSIVRYLNQTRNRIRDLTVQRVTLHDAFIALTDGRRAEKPNV